MEIKTKLEDYQTDTIGIEVNGKEVDLVIRSLASREFKRANAEYAEVLIYAEKNQIPLEETVKEIKLGVEIEVTRKTEFNRKAIAGLLASLVVNWEFEEDLQQVIFENESFGNAIDIAASTLAVEFNAKKKT